MKDKLILILFILTSLIAMSISFASAEPYTLQTIDNCFNVSVHVRLLNGVHSSYSLVGMSQSGQDWFVDCKNLGSFNVSFQPGDLTSLPSDEWRHYEFNITYYQYALNSSTGVIVLSDFGDRVQVMGKDIVSQIDNKIVVPQLVYQDRIVYVNVSQPIYKTVYIDRNITQIEYVENTSKIDELNKSLEFCSFSYHDSQSKIYDEHNQVVYRNLALFICIFIIICLGSWIYDLKKKVKK